MTYTTQYDLEYKGSIFDYSNKLSLFDLLDRGLTEEEKNYWLVGARKVRKTKALFIDMESDDRSSNFWSIYTLVDSRPLHYKDYNGMVRYDLKQLYLGCKDITEVEFVSKFMYDQSHWDKICGNKYIYENYVSLWREELKTKLESEIWCPNL